MEAYKSEFIEFMVQSDVLKFGDFTLKSGRKSPFFMNAGAYVTGSQLKRLGEYYAKAIHANYGDDFDVLFGPAYKGIPLAVVTAIAYSELYGKEVRYCSDRKEAKDHGADKGGFLGSSLKDGDRVVMIEDVTTSGKSMDGFYDNGNTILLGQIAVAQFANASGLEKVGNNCYQTTLNSGEFDGIGVEVNADGSAINSGELEMSNVDLSGQFTDMIVTQRGFQANSRVITTSDTLLEELINLKR